MALRFVFSALSLTLTLGCSGAAPSPKTSDDAETEQREEPQLSEEDKEEQARADAEEERRKREQEEVDQPELKKEPAQPSRGDVPEPKWVEGGSVNDAINAVPQGLERENLEQEALDRPLLDPVLYQPCKGGPNQHFQIRFAVWDGKIVGLDISSAPKNPSFESCLREVVSRAKWPRGDRTRSLNISTVSF